MADTRTDPLEALLARVEDVLAWSDESADDPLLAAFVSAVERRFVERRWPRALWPRRTPRPRRVPPNKALPPVRYIADRCWLRGVPLTRRPEPPPPLERTFPLEVRMAMGTLPDAEVANLAGRRLNEVRFVRMRLGIRPHRADAAFATFRHPRPPPPPPPPAPVPFVDHDPFVPSPPGAPRAFREPFDCGGRVAPAPAEHDPDGDGDGLPFGFHVVDPLAFV